MVTYNIIKYLILYFKYSKILKKAYADENLIQGLSRLFHTEFREDWIGRIYCVFNPFIKDGVYNPNDRIFDYTDSGANTDVYVEHMILSLMGTVDKFIQINNLFDLVNYDIKRLDDNANYLFVIKPLPFDNLKKWLKLSWIPLIIIVSLIIYIII